MKLSSAEGDQSTKRYMDASVLDQVNTDRPMNIDMMNIVNYDELPAPQIKHTRNAPNKTMRQRAGNNLIQV